MTSGCWPGLARRIVVSLLVWFVIGNLVMANFATVITKLTLHVQVIADDSGDPIVGAGLFWAPRMGLERVAMGTSGGDGRCTISETFAVAPYWLWPRIGKLEFGRAALEVHAPGFRPAIVLLSEALPHVSYANSDAPLLVRLLR